MVNIALFQELQRELVNGGITDKNLKEAIRSAKDANSDLSVVEGRAVVTLAVGLKTVTPLHDESGNVGGPKTPASGQDDERSRRLAWDGYSVG